MATIEDVAKRAGVSKALVSRYLNLGTGVGEKNRERIAAAIGELGYRPNELARSLVMKRTNTIGVVFDSLCYVQIFELIKGLSRGAAEAGYSLVYCDCSAGEDRVQTKLGYIDFLTKGRVDGIVLYGSFQGDLVVAQELQSLHFPFVLVENHLPSIAANEVLVDNRGGMAAVTRALWEKGAREIRFVCWRTDTFAGSERLEGYLDFCREVGIAPTVYGADQDLTVGRQMDTLVELMAENLPDALAFGADILAFEAILHLRKLGLEDKVMIGGFDNDLYVSRDTLMPRFITAEQPLYEMGARAVLQLKGAIMEGRVESKTYPVRVVNG